MVISLQVKRENVSELQRISTQTENINSCLQELHLVKINMKSIEVDFVTLGVKNIL